MASLALDELKRLFRFGFIAYPVADEPRGDSTWKALVPSWHCSDVSGFRCRWHPEARLCVIPSDDGSIVVVGDVFSVGGRAVDEILGQVRYAAGRLSGLEGLDDLSGRFALLCVKPAGLVALNDAFGARSLFYKTSGTFALSSHAQLLAHAFGIRRRASIAALMRSPTYANRAVKYLPGHATVYENVSAVIPNHAVHSTSQAQMRYWPRAPRKDSTIDVFNGYIQQYLDGLVGFLRSSARVPVVGITGGIDSRVLVAAFATAGLDFRGVTWRGKYLRDEEVDVVEAMQRGLNMKHLDLDARQLTTGPYARLGDRNAGNFRGPSRLIEGMYRLFGDVPRAVFVRGYGGEILRGFYNLMPKPIVDLGISSMSRLYGTRVSSAATGDAAYRAVVTSCFSDFHRSGDFDHLVGLGYDANDIFYWEHRMGMWGSAMLNEMDVALYSIVGFNSRRLYELAFGLPNAQRLTKNLLKGVVERQNPWLASLPYT